MIVMKLSSRELEIINLILSEYTKIEIAQKLFISVEKVKTRRRNLMNK